MPNPEPPAQAETPPQGGGTFLRLLREERPGSLSAKECGKPHCPAYDTRPDSVHRSRAVSGPTAVVPAKWRAPLEPSPGGQSSSESLLGNRTPRDSRELPKSDLTDTRPDQQKTPLRGGGAFLGLLQGGEICISVYVDRWEVGGPLTRREGSSREIDGHRMGGARPNREDRLKQAFHRSLSVNP